MLFTLQAFNFSRKRYGPIAVDFGGDSLKLLQLSADEPTRVIAAASAVVPATARRDQGARQAFVAQTLPRLLQRGGFQGRRVICSLPATQSLVQHVEVPAVEDEDSLELQVQLQLRERMDVDPDRMVVRYFPVAQVTREGQAMQDVLCVAAGRDVVMRYVELLTGLKLNVVGMHSETMALHAALAHLPAGQATCLIDIGAATTKMVIVQDGAVALAKTIQLAGDELTQQYATQHRMDFEQARRTRIEQATHAAALAPAGDEAASNTAGDAGTATAAPPSVSTGLPALDAQPSTAAGDGDGDALETLIDELQMGLRYHRRLFAQRPVSKLVFLGGEAKQVELCQQIARTLQVAAQVGDPLALLEDRAAVKADHDVDLGQPQPGWAVALGLCLSKPNL